MLWNDVQTFICIILMKWHFFYKRGSGRPSPNKYYFQRTHFPPIYPAMFMYACIVCINYILSLCRLHSRYGIPSNNFALSLSFCRHPHGAKQLEIQQCTKSFSFNFLINFPLDLYVLCPNSNINHFLFEHSYRLREMNCFTGI